MSLKRVGDNRFDRLAHAQALGVVDKAGGGAGLAHLLELASVLPGVGPGSVAGGIANGIVGNRRAIVGRELVLPVAVPVGVRHGFQRGAHGSGGVGIAGLAQDVSAPVVGVHPGGARDAAGGIVLVIDPDQLAQIVVNIPLMKLCFLPFSLIK